MNYGKEEQSETYSFGLGQKRESQEPLQRPLTVKEILERMTPDEKRRLLDRTPSDCYD